MRYAQMTSSTPVLVRLDSGNDSGDNIKVFPSHFGTDDSSNAWQTGTIEEKSPEKAAWNRYPKPYHNGRDNDKACPTNQTAIQTQG